MISWMKRSMTNGARLRGIDAGSISMPDTDAHGSGMCQVGRVKEGTTATGANEPCKDAMTTIHENRTALYPTAGCWMGSGLPRALAMQSCRAHAVAEVRIATAKLVAAYLAEPMACSRPWSWYRVIMLKPMCMRLPCDSDEVRALQAWCCPTAVSVDTLTLAIGIRPVDCRKYSQQHSAMMMQSTGRPAMTAIAFAAAFLPPAVAGCSWALASLNTVTRGVACLQHQEVIDESGVLAFACSCDAKRSAPERRRSCQRALCVPAI
jgi:hypothetical protein